MVKMRFIYGLVLPKIKNFSKGCKITPGQGHSLCHEMLFALF
jgi:hypothetical protein